MGQRLERPGVLPVSGQLNIADHYAAYAGQSARTDRIEERMERLEIGNGS